MNFRKPWRLLDRQAPRTAETDEIRTGLTAMERLLAGGRREAALDAEISVNVQTQVDRLGRGIERIDRRPRSVEA